MKRTALKRTGGGLRRTRLKGRSTKRRQQDREVNDLAEFSSLFIGGMCWICWIHEATQIHHIAGRASKLRHHRCNLLAVCDSPCHSDILPGMSVSAQFVLKRLRDRDGFDPVIAQQLLHAKNSRRDLL